MAKHVHFLGIGGSGASAAAAIAQPQGFEVTGCDLEINNEFTEKFKKSQLLKGHSPSHLGFNPEVSIQFHPRGGSRKIDILAVTPAIYSLDPDNPELLEAKRQGIETLTWQQFMGKYLMKDKFVIAVTGTHGKTTTTAMVAKILEDAGLDPTAELGALVPWWGKNFRTGKGKYFVVEADEYYDNFLSFKSDIAVVTNIEMDHPEYFKDFEAYKKSFNKFLKSAKQTVTEIKKDLIDFPLQVPGEFNIKNASLAYQVGVLLEIDPQTIKKSLSTYKGAGKRFEYIGDYKGAKVYSDFGHHPTEIKITMEAVREKFPNQRILLIYQPHMFTRTKYLFNDFVKVFKHIPVDKVFILDIYQSREKDLGLVTSEQLAEAVGKESVTYIGSPNETLDNLKSEIKQGDIVFFMSAGDTDKLAKELVFGH